MTANFNLTNNAIKQISKLLQNEPNNSKLRISVDGGGCNGFQYDIKFSSELNQDDKIFTFQDSDKKNIEVVIDEVSLNFLGNSELDYEISLGFEHFKINNPNAASSCGCGNSFSV